MFSDMMDDMMKGKLLGYHWVEIKNFEIRRIVIFFVHD